MEHEPIIRTVGLRKAYGNVIALDDLTIEVPRASVGFLGANGAGKATLISLLLGLRRPSAGTMTVLGRDVATEAATVRSLVGYMPESDCLPRDVTAAEFVGHMAAISGLPPEAARLRAAETLYHCGLEEERYRPIGGFSTGMKQRVKLAQALVHGPELLFLDEPTNGLDPSGRTQMLELVKRIYRELGITIVLSSHVLEDVEQTCDYVVILAGGRVIANGHLATLLGGGGDLLVEIDGPDEARAGFVATLGSAGVTVTPRDGALLIPRKDEAVYDLIRDTAVDTGVALRSLRSEARSLEDVYLDRVGAATPVGSADG
ncbi:MAG: ABC transporter ATP-binding protein [Chloroflexia bacterium]